MHLSRYRSLLNKEQVWFTESESIVTTKRIIFTEMWEENIMRGKVHIYARSSPTSLIKNCLKVTESKASKQV